MPPWAMVQDLLLYLVLPAFLGAALVMAGVERLGGAKQAPAGAALGLMVGAFLGLWLSAAGPMVMQGSLGEALAALPHALTLISGESSWNRIPWAVLGALCVGRVAYLADVHSGDGWLLRGGTAIAIAFWLIPDLDREETYWLAPALAATIGALWVLLDRLAALPASSSVAGCLTLSLLTAAGVLIHAGAARLMNANVVLAFALIGVWGIAYWRGVEIGGVMPAIAVALPGLLLMGQRSVEEKLPWSAFALPAFAPLLLAATLPVSHWPKLRVHLIRVALVLIPLGIAMALAREAGPLSFGDEGGE